ncbi:MAG: peptidylprolyl isomerase [Bdellovibrionales bacterium]
MRFVLSLLLLIGLSLAPVHGWAQRVNQLPGAEELTAPSSDRAFQPKQSANPVLRNRVVAVVNDGIVSSIDLNERMKLAMLSSGMASTTEVAQRILPQVLRGLIEEQLQLQEAKKLGITVSKVEIDQALERIARDNRIPGDMRSFVAAHGASPQAMEQQVRGGISWMKVVQRELRPRVDVGDDEVQAAIDRMRANVGKDEYHVSEIFLAVDRPTDEEQVRQFAENLVQQIRGGANFPSLAHQFSQSAGAATGGDLGWIQSGQLPDELNRALVAMQPNQISDPIRSSSGIHILALRDRRIVTLGDGNAVTPQDITLSLQQTFRPFTDSEPRDQLMREGERLRSSVSECQSLPEKLKQNFPGWRWQSLGNVKEDKLPSWLADQVRGLSVGSGSQPIATDKGLLVVFLCGRLAPEGKIDRDAIVNSLGTEKLELLARRLLRDLRKNAYIDIKPLAGG